MCTQAYLFSFFFPLHPKVSFANPSQRAKQDNSTIRTKVVYNKTLYPDLSILPSYYPHFCFPPHSHINFHAVNSSKGRGTMVFSN